MGSSRPPAAILLVGDNVETRTALATLLQMRCYAVATADDGLEALEYLRARYPVSLVVLDLRMPVMDGWAFARAVQADPELAGIPLIAFSALSEANVPGAVASLRKSVDPDVLLVLIERLCVRQY